MTDHVEQAMRSLIGWVGPSSEQRVRTVVREAIDAETAGLKAKLAEYGGQRCTATCPSGPDCCKVAHWCRLPQGHAGGHLWQCQQEAKLAETRGPVPGVLLVAGIDAPADVRATADYVCDGVDDDVEIQAAVDALPPIGGKVILAGMRMCGKTIELRDGVVFEVPVKAQLARARREVWAKAIAFLSARRLGEEASPRWLLCQLKKMAAESELRDESCLAKESTDGDTR